MRWHSNKVVALSLASQAKSNRSWRLTSPAQWRITIWLQVLQVSTETQLLTPLCHDTITWSNSLWSLFPLCSIISLIYTVVTKCLQIKLRLWRERLNKEVFKQHRKLESAVNHMIKRFNSAGEWKKRVGLLYCNPSCFNFTFKEESRTQRTKE